MMMMNLSSFRGGHDPQTKQACRGMKHLRAGASIHGEVGQTINHLVVGAHLLGPVPHAKLTREPTSLRVEPEKSGVLGMPVIALSPTTSKLGQRWTAVPLRPLGRWWLSDALCSWTHSRPASLLSPGLKHEQNRRQSPRVAAGWWPFLMTHPPFTKKCGILPPRRKGTGGRSKRQGFQSSLRSSSDSCSSLRLFLYSSFPSRAPCSRFPHKPSRNCKFKPRKFAPKASALSPTPQQPSDHTVSIDSVPNVPPCQATEQRDVWPLPMRSPAAIARGESRNVRSHSAMLDAVV
jgi:hypothetical protein